MKQLPLVVMSWCFIALGAVGCSRAPQPRSSAAPTPPPGIRYESNMAAGGVAPPATELKNPQQNGTANVTAGETLFATMNCDGCHGGGGTGWVGPSLVDGRWRYGGADDEVFSSIYFGRPKGMPAFGGIVGTDGIWMLVAYLKSQPVPGVVPTTWYGEAERNPAGGAAAATPQSTATVPTTATTPEQMLANYGCTACHAVDHKVIGPALADVAAKYKGTDVEKTLAEKVRNGGSGVWGTVPMTPNPQVPDQDLHKLVNWVLALH